MIEMEICLHEAEIWMKKNRKQRVCASPALFTALEWYSNWENEVSDVNALKDVIPFFLQDKFQLLNNVNVPIFISNMTMRSIPEVFNTSHTNYSYYLSSSIAAQDIRTLTLA